MKLIFIILKNKESGGFDKLVVRDEELIVNKNKFSINDINIIEAEIREHIKVYDYIGGEYIEKTMPSGTIHLRLRNGYDIIVETLNPLTKLEELVLRLNIIYEDKNLLVVDKPAGQSADKELMAELIKKFPELYVILPPCLSVALKL